MKTKQIHAAIVVAAALLASAAHAQQTQTVSATFAECKQVIKNVAVEYGVTPISVVKSNILHMERINTSDGSVLISCSKPDQKMIITTNKG